MSTPAPDLYAQNPETDESRRERKKFLPVLAGYVIAILIGLVLPAVAIGFYCAIGIYLVVPFREVARLLFRRP